MSEVPFEAKNRFGLTVRGLKTMPEGRRPESLSPIILLHGFKGFMRMPMLTLLAKSLAEARYMVFRFDATNGLGESDGDIYKSSVTSFISDTQAVLDFVLHQGGEGCIDPCRLSLFGTSMGGLVATLVAEDDRRVRNLIIHSGAFSWEIIRKHPDVTEWREGEWIEFLSKTKNLRFKVGFNLYADGLKYDPYPGLKELRIPKLFIHSERDEAIPQHFSERAFREAAEPKQLVIISGANHNITDSETIGRMADEITFFLSKYSSNSPNPY